MMSRLHRPSLQLLARAGYMARGLVFVILAYFTAFAALDVHTQPVDSKGALETLLSQPRGSMLIGALTIGLLCFGLWREAQCFGDIDSLGTSPKGLARRFVYAAAGLFYVAFASVTLSMVIGAHTRETEGAVHDWTALLLGQRFGRFVVGVIGCSIIVGGVCIGIAGIRAEFSHRIALAEKQRRWVVVLGTAGYLTRAAVIAVIGLYVVFAALDSNAHEAAGLAGALTIIKRLTYGGALLALAAAGFLAFGLYGIAEAFFRRIDGRKAMFSRSSWLGA